MTRFSRQARLVRRMHLSRRVLKGMLKTAAATAAFASIHSLLASRPAKEAAGRILGERRRNALYRPLYNIQSVVTFAALVWYIRRQPCRVLWHVRPPAAWLMQTAQAGLLGYAVWAAREVGIGEMVGLRGLWALRCGKRDIPPGQEAQGPAFDPDAGEMRATGPFRFSRHPLNFVPAPVALLNPYMTTRLAAFVATALPYFWLGSIHEERRLRQAYGEAYDRYRGSVRPFVIPGVRPQLHSERLPGAGRAATTKTPHEIGTSAIPQPSSTTPAEHDRPAETPSTAFEMVQR